MTDADDRPGCLAAIRRALGLGAAPQKAERLLYRVRDDFLSPAERNLYGVLCAAVGEWVTACPKISLGDVFYAQSGDHSANVGYRSRIARKHVDFLLCDPRSMRPARRGAREGERFWRCADYPRCRGVRAYKPGGEG